MSEKLTDADSQVAHVPTPWDTLGSEVPLNQSQETDSQSEVDRPTAEDANSIADALLGDGSEIRSRIALRAETFADRMGESADARKVARAERRAQRADIKEQVNTEELGIFQRELEAREATREVRDYQRRAEAQMLSNDARARKDSRRMNRELKRSNRAFEPKITRTAGKLERQQGRLEQESSKLDVHTGKLNGIKDGLTNGEARLDNQKDHLGEDGAKKQMLEQKISETNPAELKMRLKMAVGKERRKALKAELKQYKADTKELKKTNKEIKHLGKDIKRTEKQNAKLTRKAEKIQPKVDKAQAKVDARTDKVQTLDARKADLSNSFNARNEAARQAFEATEEQRRQRLESIKEGYGAEITAAGDAAIAANGGVARKRAERFVQSVGDKMQAKYDNSRLDKAESKNTRIAEKHVYAVNEREAAKALAERNRAEREAREQARVAESLERMNRTKPVAEEEENNEDEPLAAAA